MTALPHHSVRPLDPGAMALAVMLCLSWGFNQVAVKLAMPDIPPLLQLTLRTLGALVLVGAWTKLRGVELNLRDGTLWPGIAAGVLFGVEFILIYRGLVFTTAVRAVLFIYLAPFFVVLGARWVLPGDRFSPSQWAGLLLSFAGIAVAFGVPEPGADLRQLVGDLMMVAAAALWAATTLVIKASSLARASFQKVLLYQLAVPLPLMALGVWIFGERIAAFPSAVALGSLAYQTFWVSVFTLLVWFALVQRYSANRLSAFTFLTPLFGVVAGHVVLGEPLTPAFVVAALMVAAGLVLVNRPH